MAIGYSRYLKTIYAIGDFFLLNAAFGGVSLYIRYPDFHADPVFLAQFLYVNLFWVITTFFTNIHKIDRGLRFEQILGQLARGFALFSFFMIAFLYLFGDMLIPVFHFETKLAIFGVCFFIWRSLMALTISFVRRRGLNYRKVIIIGNGAPAVEMQKYFLHHPEVGYQLWGIFCDETDLLAPNEIAGRVEDAKQFAITQKIDEIFCSLTGLEPDQVSDLMEFADRSMIRFRIVPDFRGFLNKKVKIDFYDSVPVLSVRNEPLQNYGNRIVKRAFDIFFSLLVFLLVFPVAMLLIAPLIKLSSKGPVFFKQMRSGRDNITFNCWKFRTMQVNENADVEQARKGDARITKIGSFLRKTSFDELPQFYNTLIGNMSVVGPRPHMLRHTEEYSEVIDKFMVRHFVKPGITGWAQVHGLRGETRNHSLMEKRVQYDVWYLENWSLLLDIKIIILTIIQILSGKHAGE
jgi:putative colanic acid biosysnthesis UDP-glucose lipid carrier transferase